MRPSEVTLNFGTPQDSPRTSSDFEEIHYPHYQPSSQGQPEELPLHYMSEETTRRRVHQHSELQYSQQQPAGYADYPVYPAEHDDGGKDVYAKMRQSHGGLGGGRPRRLPPPPPKSVVRPSASVTTFCSVCRYRVP
jgi:dolichyl-phosphate-mannose-protein mannosyltransferase